MVRAEKGLKDVASLLSSAVCPEKGVSRETCGRHVAHGGLVPETQRPRSRLASQKPSDVVLPAFCLSFIFPLPQAIVIQFKTREHLTG